jgi:catechol 2,3-dioxygenase-like lactoylglutathione lyase family enzyme
MTPQPASTEVDSSSVLLRVSSIERATRFCQDVLGFRVVVYGPDLGLQAACLSAGVRQRFLLTTWDSPDDADRSAAPGDPYVSLCYPSASSFSRAVRRALLSDCEIVACWVRNGAAGVAVRGPTGTIVRLLCDQSLADQSQPARGERRSAAKSRTISAGRRSSRATNRRARARMMTCA